MLTLVLFMIYTKGTPFSPVFELYLTRHLYLGWNQARTMQSLTQVYNCNQFFSLALTANIEKANIKNKKILTNHTLLHV